MESLAQRSPFMSGGRLGDRAAVACWARACYFLDFTYILLVGGDLRDWTEVNVRVLVTDDTISPNWAPDSKGNNFRR